MRNRPATFSSLQLKLPVTQDRRDKSQILVCFDIMAKMNIGPYTVKVKQCAPA